MIRLLIFASVSLLLIAVSWNSLRVPGSHGFYRFFAWEAIAALILSNAPYWFKNPFGWQQILSWLLLLASFVPLFFGVHALRTRGTPASRREGDSSLLAFEKTTRLVNTSIYRYIRHPLYSSLLLLTWGTFFKSLSWISGLLAAAATLFLFATARADEGECIQFFGEEYRLYMRQTKMFIPYLL